MPQTSGIGDVVVKIMVEILSILAIATKELNQKSASELVPLVMDRPSRLGSSFSRSIFEEVGGKERYR
jgi:hypothetical protein